jgi:hypothetical protein
MPISEKTSTTLWGSEFGDGVVWVDGDGVPEVWGEGGVEGFVDEAAEEKVVL